MPLPRLLPPSHARQDMVSASSPACNSKLEVVFIWHFDSVHATTTTVDAIQRFSPLQPAETTNRPAPYICSTQSWEPGYVPSWPHSPAWCCRLTPALLLWGFLVGFGVLSVHRLVYHDCQLFTSSFRGRFLLVTILNDVSISYIKPYIIILIEM